MLLMVVQRAQTVPLERFQIVMGLLQQTRAHCALRVSLVLVVPQLGLSNLDSTLILRIPLTCSSVFLLKLVALLVSKRSPRVPQAILDHNMGRVSSMSTIGRGRGVQSVVPRLLNGFYSC